MQNNQDRVFTGKWIKKPNGALDFKFPQEKELFNSLLKNMRIGQVLDFQVDFSDDLGRLSQISKLKAGIREISRETGEIYINTEKRIKKDSGLYDEIADLYKSFGNCSVSQLSDAIQVMIEHAEFVGINLL